MPDLAVSGVIVGNVLEELVLDETTGYIITEDGFGPGSRVWRRITAESPFVHGRVLIHAVRDTQQAPLSIRVVASSASQLATRIATLIEHLEQSEYLLEITVGGVLYRWRCEMADSSPGNGTFDNELLFNHQQVINFTIPRAPIPLAGPV